MTTTLTSVTLQTLDNYRLAANLGVAAYRDGSLRLVSAVNGALKDGVYARTERVAPLATERLNEAREAVTRAVEGGIDRIATDTEKAIETASSAAADQVRRIGELAERIENPSLVNGLQAAVRLSMPGAQFGLLVSGKLAEGVEALAKAAAPKTPVSQAATATRKAAKKVGRRAAKVAKVAKAEVVKVKRATRAAGRRVAEVAAEA